MIKNILLKFVVSAIAIGSIAQLASAHFPWIVPPVDDSKEFQVVFGEDLTDDGESFLERLVDHPVLAYRSDDTVEEIKLAIVDGRLVGTLPRVGETVMLEMPFTWGLFAPADETFLLRYRAMCLLAPKAPVAMDADHSSFGPEIRISFGDVATSIAVQFAGQPLRDTKLSMIGPKLEKVETDGNGVATIAFPKPGEYGLRCNGSIAQAGQWKGEDYQSIRCYSTITFKISEANVRHQNNSSATVNTDSSAAMTTPLVFKDSKFAPLPQTLTSFGAARCGNAIFAYGGHIGDAHEYSLEEQSDQLIRLDLSQPKQAWRVVATDDRLQGHAMVAHGEQLIRMGGFTARNTADKPQDLHSSNAVKMYDNLSDKWTDLPALPEPRSSFESTILGEVIYVVGGWQLNDPDEQVWHKTAWKLDLSKDQLTWEAIAEPPFQRRALSVAVWGDKIIAVGGMEPKGGITKSTAIYDPANDSWSEGPQLVGEGQMTGFGTASIGIADGVIVNSIDGTLQKLSLGAEDFEIIGKTNQSRFFQQLIRLDDSTLLSIGGANMEKGKFYELEEIKLP